MPEKMYGTDSEVWKLFKRIEDETNKVFESGSGYRCPGSDPKLDDIVIEGSETINGKKVSLRGGEGFSGIVYKWYAGENWALAEFVYDGDVKAAIKNQQKLLNALQEHYGKATKIDNDKLFYKIKIGERTTASRRIVEKYDLFTEERTEEGGTEDIIRTMILDFDFTL
ncbi:MAG: hypothetical protein JSV92_02850 [archaeon]|nr:MAG: hypothetical protein JSV92_02850 [archaeon]